MILCGGVHCGTDKHQPACHPQMRQTFRDKTRIANKPHFVLDRIGPRRPRHHVLQLPFRRIYSMASSFSRPHATAVVLDDEQVILRSATCPMCHTSATLSQSALEAGGAWRCVRCGQHWDAARLAAVAAYAAWTVDHDRVVKRGITEGSHDAAHYRGSPAERLGGRS